MNLPRVLFAVVVLICCLPTAFGADPVPVSLDRLVSIERQRALGLDKLTPEQRAGIVRLLQEAYQLGVQSAQSPAAVRGGSAGTASVVETQVDGEFNGWEGETIVKLSNGQIWQQSEYHYEYHYAYMPKVLVYQSGSGYKMKVDGLTDAVSVKRLR